MVNIFVLLILIYWFLKVNPGLFVPLLSFVGLVGLSILVLRKDILQVFIDNLSNLEKVPECTIKKCFYMNHSTFCVCTLKSRTRFHKELGYLPENVSVYSVFICLS